MRFTDRNVMITGAAGHLGRALAEAFAAEGAALWLVGRSAATLEAAFGSETPQRVHLAADLLDRTRLAAVVQAAAERHGPIDVLCNAAGGFRMGAAVHELDDAAWSAMIDANVRTLLNAVHAAAPHLRTPGGKVVNVAAAAALKGAAGTGAYVAAKSAVIRLTEAMAEEWRERGVHVNCVLPTLLDTPDNRAAMPGADTAGWVRLADAAQAMLFLASDAASAVTGAALPLCARGDRPM